MLIQAHLPSLCTCFNNSIREVYPGFALSLYSSLFLKEYGFLKIQTEKNVYILLCTKSPFPWEWLVISLYSFFILQRYAFETKVQSKICIYLTDLQRC